jgi:NAD(P)-dependent dehydrogenase (short-subunit alcohol dehydrogenase family)
VYRKPRHNETTLRNQENGVTLSATVGEGDLEMPRTWFITGSSRGLGRELAEAVLEAGDQLVATARNPEQLADLVAQHPGRARAIALDVTNSAQADAAIAAAVDAFGRIDVVVNNAGYANIGAIEDFTEDDFRAQIETNLWGVINVTRAALPVLRPQRSGHIIQISSVGGRIVSAGLGPYQTAKWAVEGFSGVLQQEVAPLGIHVTIVEPGGLSTDWAGSSMTLHDVRDDYAGTVGARVRQMREGALHPLGDPRKAAQAIVEISEVADPPLRLLLGTDAYELARAGDREKAASDERWRELSVSTDHDGAGPQIEALRQLLGLPAS